MIEKEDGRYDEYGNWFPRRRIVQKTKFLQWSIKMSFDELERIRELKEGGFTTQEAVIQTESERMAFDNEMKSRDDESKCEMVDEENE